MAARRLLGKKSGLVFSGIFLFSFLAHSMPDPSYSTHLTDLEGEVNQGIVETQKDIDNLLIKLNRVNLSPVHGPDRLISSDNPELRNKLKSLLNSALKMRINHLEHLKKQKNYLVGDYQISQALPVAANNLKTIISVANFKCNFFPLKNDEKLNTFEKVFSFGDYINPALGKSSAKTQGIWWGNTFGALVRSCAAGEIVMSEFVPGRGYVVGIRHNAQNITLYGNLDANSLKSLKTGMKVPEGAALGFALERFYFEARRGSEAIDPNEIIGQESDINSAAR